jgi:transcriptional regulator with XRE-family HTH domain
VRYTEQPLQKGGIQVSEVEIGSRLRRAREKAGMSQRALAKRAGITNSTVSLMESNGTNPSIGALKRVLDAMSVSLSDFFAMDEPDDYQLFYRASELTEIGKGPISLCQVGRNMGGRRLQILSETWQPGADTGKISLTHEGEEAGVVISGFLEITVDDERRILGPGDAYSFDSRRPHRVRCVGDQPARCISACTPPNF